MNKLAIAAAVALTVSGCAHAPSMKQSTGHQVNRAKKADKYVMPKKAAPVEMPAPNQVIAKRWYDGWKVRWLH